MFHHSGYKTADTTDDNEEEDVGNVDADIDLSFCSLQRENSNSQGKKLSGVKSYSTFFNSERKKKIQEQSILQLKAALFVGGGGFVYGYEMGINA